MNESSRQSVDVRILTSEIDSEPGQGYRCAVAHGFKPEDTVILELLVKRQKLEWPAASLQEGAAALAA